VDEEQPNLFPATGFPFINAATAIIIAKNVVAVVARSAVHQVAPKAARFTRNSTLT